MYAIIDYKFKLPVMNEFVLIEIIYSTNNWMQLQCTFKITSKIDGFLS